MSDEHDYPNTPREVLEQIRAIVPLLPGWMTPERCCELADAIFETRPRLCVEIGVFGGRSLVAQAMALRAAGHGGVVAGLDPWRTDDALEGENEANQHWWSNLDIEAIHRRAMAAIWDNHLEAHTVVVRSASQHAAPLFSEIDMLLVDGNHSEVASTRDVELYVPKVRSGAYIVADDYDWPSVQKAYTRLQEMADVVKYGHEVNAEGETIPNRYLVCRKR